MKPVAAADWQDYYEDAVDRYRGGEYNAAVIQLKNTLRDNPGFLPASILLGRAYLAVGDEQAAALELRNARRNGADPENVAVPLARAYLAQKKYKELEEEANRPGYSAKVRADLLTVLGIAYNRQNEIQKAETALIEASVLAPGASAPVLARASLHFNQSNLDEASRLVEQARALAPEDPEAWKLTADIARQNNDMEAALSAYNRALELAPEHTPARLGRLMALLSTGKADVVLSEIQDIREAREFNPEAEYLYAEALYRTGEAEQARKVVRDAEARFNTVNQELVVSSPSLTMLSALLAFEDGNFGKAREQAARVLVPYPNHLGARLIMGQVLLRQGKPKEALEYLGPLRRRLRGNVRFQVAYGQALMNAKYYLQAKSVLEETLELTRNKAPIQVDLALCHLALGERDKAIANLETAFLSGDRRAGMLLADVQMKARDLKAAKQTLGELLRKAPNDLTLLNLLGVAHVAAREFDLAEAVFLKARSLPGDPTPAELNLATLSLQRDRRDEAREYLNAVLAREHNSRMAFAGLAMLAEREADYQGAIAWLEKLRAYHPRAKREILRLIELVLKHGNPEQAQLIAQDLLNVESHDFDVNFAMGRVELAKGQLDNAKLRFRRITRFASYNPRELYRLADLQMRSGDMQGARWSLEKAAEATPLHAPAYVQLVALLYRSGESEKALEYVDRLQKALPESGLADSLRGDLWMYTGHYEDGLNAYLKAFGQSPNPELVVKRYQARKLLGMRDEAVRELESWVAQHPDDVQGRQTLATAYLDSGKLEAAIAYTEQLKEDFPDHAGIYNNLAWLYHQASDPRASSLAEQAYALKPDNPDVLDTYGWLLVLDGKVEKGLGMLRDASSRDANNPTILYHLAAVLQRLGRRDEALEKARGALELKKPFSDELAARKLIESLAP